jgi:Molybdopterin biosynthesis enzyme
VLGPGEAIRVETGALLPEGADAVVPVEDAVEEGSRVLILKKVARFENVSLPGEEYDEGLVILERGSRVTPVAVAALTLEGRGSLRVYDLRARLLNVGDEIVSGTYFRPFTHLFVASWLEQHGVKVVEVSQAGDDEEAVGEWVSRGGAYLAVLIGGTSMGGHDVTVKAVERLKPELLVHGFAVQPGKTACLAVLGGRPVVALSGLPVAAMSTLELVLKPLLRGLGLRLPEYPRVRAQLTRRLTTKAGLLGFARVRVFESGGKLLAEPVMVGGSGSLVSLLRGNGFVVVPEDVEGYDEGEVVEVHLYGGVPQA